ncbi:MAG: dicarboxylate/amino acid:cation symporter [Bacteroidales bacterium]|nr:dicarboxylate/amino acid:cation symporter [Bacteroidales bacterium]MDD3910855.1 dicarboxylate/amino acid:cation symporter [Bacteroidales bacterium]MDD4420090.1 dicarboxylate/amino acid:cation symporter [Bacteroidales bacterium]
MKHFKLALPWQILIGLVLGCLFGYFLYDYARYVQWAGDIFLRALKMIIIPMVFTSLVVGVASIQSSADLGRIAGKTLLYYVCTTVMAIIVGLLLVNFFKPGVGANLQLPTADLSGVGKPTTTLYDQVIHIIPENIFADIAAGNLLPIIFFAIIFGFFITRCNDKTRTTLVDLCNAVNDVIMKITLFIIKLAPYGVFAIVSNMVAKQGGDSGKLFAMIGSLGFYLIIVWAGLLIQFFGVLPGMVYGLGRENPWKHMNKMSTAILTAFTTCSSGAALPISLRDTQEKCGVSKKIASFVLPLGATVNMNGTALYEGVTVLFIAQVYGVDLSIAQQIIIIGTVLLSAIGAAGIPMAGFVMLSIALSVAGLPLEAMGLVLAIDQLCDMPRTAVNSFGDACGAVIIAKSEGEKLTIS